MYRSSLTYSCVMLCLWPPMTKGLDMVSHYHHLAGRHNYQQAVCTQQNILQNICFHRHYALFSVFSSAAAFASYSLTVLATCLAMLSKQDNNIKVVLSAMQLFPYTVYRACESQVYIASQLRVYHRCMMFKSCVTYLILCICRHQMSLTMK